MDSYAASRSVVFRRLWLEQFSETVARAMDAALDRPDRNAANLGGLLVGKALCSDQYQGFPLG